MTFSWYFVYTLRFFLQRFLNNFFTWQIIIDTSRRKRGAKEHVQKRAAFHLSKRVKMTKSYVDLRARPLTKKVWPKGRTVRSKVRAALFMSSTRAKCSQRCLQEDKFESEKLWFYNFAEKAFCLNVKKLISLSILKNKVKGHVGEVAPSARYLKYARRASYRQLHTLLWHLLLLLYRSDKKGSSWLLFEYGFG